MSAAGKRHIGPYLRPEDRYRVLSEIAEGWL